MEGLALALDSSSSNALHSAALLSASSVAGIASLFPRNWAFCDAKVDSSEDDWLGRWMPTYGTEESKRYAFKTYDIELKPLFSAFRPKALGTTGLRALLVNFLPLLEAYMKVEEDEDDEEDRPTETSPDFRLAFKRSGTHAFREVSVITVRRVLERIVEQVVSARTAWKLLKDVPKSAVRKARRHITKIELFTGVAKTTFRAHALGVGASCLVQEVLDIYRSGRVIYIHRQNPGRAKGNKKEIDVLHSLARRTAGNSLKAVASLTCASIGAGCGAVLIKPSTGTWIGLAVGDLAGAFLVGYCLDSWIYKTSSS
ncbi:uncharacterized protein LOC9649803 [Selaginella moellendorffii]|nr:uncharacterized protein LOC9649803 [Selaginella moellendorffii]|eukprot:XP_024537624.1 uncharacterized protein LOC9649803 [Selaginella moellendorffii]